MASPQTKKFRIRDSLPWLHNDYGDETELPNWYQTYHENMHDQHMFNLNDKIITYHLGGDTTRRESKSSKSKIISHPTTRRYTKIEADRRNVLWVKALNSYTV